MTINNAEQLKAKAMLLGYELRRRNKYPHQWDWYQEEPPHHQSNWWFESIDEAFDDLIKVLSRASPPA